MPGRPVEAGGAEGDSRAGSSGHCVTQCYFDGRWNLFDGDMHSMYLLRDNQTVACEQDLVRDHDLIRRTHTQGILNPDRRANDEWEASIFMFEGPPAGDRNCVQDTTMNMVLRPGEAITWRWGHASPLKYHGEKPRYPDTIGNGLWEYRPDFSNDLWKKGAATIADVTTKSGDLIAEEGKTGTIVWIIRSPYVLVGGRLKRREAARSSRCRGTGNRGWRRAGPRQVLSARRSGTLRISAPLRAGAGARLKRLGIVNDIQMAPLALPAMSIGDNKFVYTDQSPGERQCASPTTGSSVPRPGRPELPRAHVPAGQGRRRGHAPGVPLGDACPLSLGRGAGGEGRPPSPIITSSCRIART